MKMSDMPLSKRIQYIWDYYKVPLFTAALLLYILGYIIWRFATKQEIVLYAAAVNTQVSQEGEEVLQAFPQSGFISPKEEKSAVSLAANLFLTSDPTSEYHEYVYASRLKVLASIEAQNLDLVIADREALDAFASEGFLLDLTEVFGADTGIRERLTELSVILEDNHIDALLDDEIAYEAVTEASLYAVDISDLPFFTTGSGEVFLGVIANSPRGENAVSFVRYLIKEAGSPSE